MRRNAAISIPVLMLTATLTVCLAMARSQTPSPRDEGMRMALRNLELRADSGDGDALYHMARLYERGYDTIAPDTMRAAGLYRKAAEAGDRRACNYYGFLIYNGRYGISAPDHAQGRQWMERAAMQGDPTAANNLGWMLLEDPDLQNEADKAAYWLTKGADAGVPTAMGMLADLYREGRGVPKDTLKAIGLYNRAIEAGLPDAQQKLLDMQHRAWGTLSPDEAVETGLYYYTHRAPTIGVVLFEQAAEAGNPRAMALMGDALTRAQGASYDHDAALKWYYRAAMAGNAPAQFVMGELMEFFPDALDAVSETAVPADHKDPSYWYEMARHGGVTDAEQATRILIGDNRK